DAIARLVSDGVVVAIKYAVVRQDPSTDAYLEGLLARVYRARVVSGMGERPAVQHMRQFGLPGFTTGSGCVAPSLSQAPFDAGTSGGSGAGGGGARVAGRALGCQRRRAGPRPSPWRPFVTPGFRRACFTPRSRRPRSP